MIFGAKIQNMLSKVVKWDFLRDFQTLFYRKSFRLFFGHPHWVCGQTTSVDLGEEDLEKKLWWTQRDNNS